MDLLAAIRRNALVEFRRDFVWTSRERRRMHITDMDTVHILNSANILVRRAQERGNGLGTSHPYFIRGEGGLTYSTQQHGGQADLLNKVFYFAWEIGVRNNLERPNDRQRYQLLLNNVFDAQFRNADLPQAIMQMHGQAPIPAFEVDVFGNRVPPTEFVAVPPRVDTRPLQHPSDLPYFRQDFIIRACEPDFLRDSIDLNPWFNDIPPSHRIRAREEAVPLMNHLWSRRREISATTIMSRFAQEFQSIAQLAIRRGLLTRNNWLPDPADSLTWQGVTQIGGRFNRRHLSNNPFFLDVPRNVEIFNVGHLSEGLRFYRESDSRSIVAVDLDIRGSVPPNFAPCTQMLSDFVERYAVSDRNLHALSDADLRGSIIRYTLAILDHNFNEGSLLPDRWRQFLELNRPIQQPSPVRDDVTIEELFTFPTPPPRQQAPPAQPARNPILFMPPAPMDYQIDQTFYVSKNKQKKNKKEEANSKLAAEKYEAELLNGARRKIRLD